jgi:hypothetical protein
MNDKVKALVKRFRDQARAILRLQAVNALVERLQDVSGKLTNRKAKITANDSKLADIAAGKYAIDISNAQDSKQSPDEIKASVITSLEKDNADLAKEVEALTKQAADLETEITSTATGAKGFAVSKSEVTRLSNELMREDNASFDLTDVSGVEDTSEDRPSVA